MRALDRPFEVDSASDSAPGQPGFGSFGAPGHHARR